jgi:hypothetical protein
MFSKYHNINSGAIISVTLDIYDKIFGKKDLKFIHYRSSDFTYISKNYFGSKLSSYSKIL